MRELFFDVDSLPDFFSRERLRSDCLFVFSTDIVKDSWIDWIVSHPERTGISAVPLEKFTAWDKFKGDFASSRDKDSARGTVPALLRKLFVRNLISRNKTERFFKSLIVPEYAQDALSFTDWMAAILPSLDFWHKSYLDYLNKEGIEEGADLDAENADLLFLYREYSAFLESHGLYEPSWIEPDFTGRSEYYIIFPELLEDFSDYADSFRSAGNITAVKLKAVEADGQRPGCYTYPDSRTELRRTLLLIRKLVSDKMARWQDISLCVPDIDTYRPYIEREARRYCVPAVIHAGESLLKSSAAAVFSKIYDCHKSRFSYDSVRALLLDAHIPWKKEFNALIENLVREGCQMHCLCQYDDRKDIWEQSLGATGGRNELELRFYQNLKKNIIAICKADSFVNILSAWMIFKKDMLEAGDFSSDSNLILGRCLEELKKLIHVWEEYVEGTGLSLEDPYEFFLSELKGAKYAYQDKSCGVRVYPYRLSAGAAFEYQFVIDASQSNLELPVKRLPFLGPSKRQALGLLELEKAENPSVSFIRLYAGLGRNEKTSYSCPVFSFAEDSFSGFAIAHSFLRPVACDPSLDSGDFIFAERDCLLSDGEEKGFAFSREMKDEAMRWLGENSPLPEEDNQAVLRDKILSLMAEKRAKSSDSRICISQSDLRDFFPCQSHWLFNRLLRLDEDNLTGDLTGAFDMGNINHKLLESFMNWRMTSKGRLPITAADGTFGDEEDEICEKLRLLAEDSIEDYSMDFRDSIISKLAFHRQKDAIVHGVLDCLHSMCRPEEEKKLSFGGWGIFAAEKILFAESGEGKWLYEGKLDCILKNDLGCLAILDYKSGMTPTIASCIAGDDGILRDYQMPMYVTLCEESGKVGDISAAAFFSIKASSATIVVQPMEKKGRSKSVDREAFEPSMAAFRNYSRVFYEKVSSCDMTPRSGSEDIYNSVDAYSDCQGCRFKTVCRTAFRVCGRKLGAALWRK